MVGIYTFEGGMISVIFADAAQFILILIGTLVGYTFIAGQVGWLSGIIEKSTPAFMNFVPPAGKFDYKFIIAILFLGINAFCCDQGIIQRSFGSKNVKTLVVASLAACNLGMYNFISEAGQAAHEGISIIWHEWTGNMAFAFCGLFIMPGFRRLNLTTIPEFMGLRYGKKAHSITAVMYALKSAGKLGLGMYLIGITGATIVPQINFYWWVLIFTVVVGIILTPVNPFHFFAGLAAPLLNANAATMDPDAIMTQLYVSSIPVGLLGVFIVGLLASQLSTVDAELNAGATVVAQDIWQRLRRSVPGAAEKLRFSRIMTVVMTALMVLFALLALASGRSVVENFLSLIGIFDTPIFVVAIIYGLKGRRINEAGAVAGYLGGALIGGITSYYCTRHHIPDYLWWTTLNAFLGALLITPLVSRFFAPPDSERVEKIRRSDKGTAEEWYSVIPRSIPGKITLGVIIAGAALFFAGIIVGGMGSAQASWMAVGGMVVYFTGCGTRLLFK
ncbi:MAG: hypothetical protein A2Z86_00525 [Candidatus Glassbacteria bacterium GWA2_58_10]|uniref:Sodium:solute symporter n=1 Tax=Candidatus Glassbacteria bacterium GWA2_58_10 TaxID=1817865 RepID=A0A1F5YGJ4_9BACT|nr:MAG: hypothetical protein A2Z86_00525 [Candidatus Glassbacteria bacterium GWA2_58_10]